MNKYKVGQVVYYLLMNNPCKSKIVDFRLEGGIYYYTDNIFNNIKECYLFTTKEECVKYHSVLR